MAPGCFRINKVVEKVREVINQTKIACVYFIASTASRVDLMVEERPKPTVKTCTRRKLKKNAISGF